MPNPDQANEDGDRFGDICDVCPTLAEDSVIDTDHDGVGNACDPHPTVAGDKITLFEGFRGGIPNWSRSEGWAVAGGSLFASGTDAGDTWLVVPAPFTDRMEVTTQITVNQLVGANSHLVGVFMPYHAPSDKGIGCLLFQPTGGATSGRIVEISDDFQSTRLASLNLAWATSTVYVIDFVRSGNNYQCTVKDGTRTTVVQGTSTSVASPPSIAILAFSLNATVDWVLATQSP